MRARCAAIALFVLLASARAAAEPAPYDDDGNPTPTLIQTTGPRWLCKGRPIIDAPLPFCREVPEGRFIDETSWLKIDGEHRRLQDALTRSDAENKSLRETAKSWRPPWWALASATLTGIALGVYIAK